MSESAISMNTSPTPLQRRKLLLMMAIFLAPPVAAWIAFHFFSSEMSSSTVNVGQLVTPARPLERFEAVDLEDGGARDVGLFKGRWTYLMFAADGCGDECLRQLYLTRQTRLGVNKDMPRVQRVLLLANTPSAQALEALRKEHPELSILRVDEPEWGRLDAFLSTDGHRLDGHSLYLLDPLGNYMMRYDLSMPPNGMLKDLRKLLKLSRIG